MICKDNIGFKKLEEVINEVEEKEMAIIPILHKAQEIFGYLPEEVQQFISQKTNIPIGRIYGIVTFYNFFLQILKENIKFLFVQELLAMYEELKKC